MAVMPWEPKDSQLRALEFARENAYVFKVQALSDLLGISRQAIYDWNRSEDFCKWWAEKRDAFFAARLDQVHGMIYARATGISNRGNSRDAKLFLERFDRAYQPHQRTEVTGPDGTALKLFGKEAPTEDV